MFRLSIFAILVATLTSLAQADQSVPECLSGLCLRGKLSKFPTEQQVNKLVGGSGHATLAMPHRKSLCYLISTPKHKGLYAKFSFIKVESKLRLIAATIASRKLCDNPEVSSLGFELLTEKNIGIDSRQEDVINAYGEPKYKLVSPTKALLDNYFANLPDQSAISIMQYVSEGEDLLTTRFFMLNNLVVGIDLSADE